MQYYQAQVEVLQIELARLGSRAPAPCTLAPFLMSYYNFLPFVLPFSSI